MKHDHYVSVYRVTRHYGGPEEGGWWFNLREHVKSSRRLKRKLWQVKARWETEWKPMSWGNIYSVLGGVSYMVTTEAVPGNTATKGTPHYE